MKTENNFKLFLKSQQINGLFIHQLRWCSHKPLFTKIRAQKKTTIKSNWKVSEKTNYHFLDNFVSGGKPNKIWSAFDRSLYRNTINEWFESESDFSKTRIK